MNPWVILAVLFTVAVIAVIVFLVGTFFPGYRDLSSLQESPMESYLRRIKEWLP